MVRCPTPGPEPAGGPSSGRLPMIEPPGVVAARPTPRDGRGRQNLVVYPDLAPITPTPESGDRPPDRGATRGRQLEPVRDGRPVDDQSPYPFTDEPHRDEEDAHDGDPGDVQHELELHERQQGFAQRLAAAPVDRPAAEQGKDDHGDEGQPPGGERPVLE